MPYQALWKSRKYAESRCLFCGGRFSIQYPALFAVFFGISLAAVILLCIFVPGSILQVIAPVLLVFYAAFYFLLPLCMKVKKIEGAALAGKKKAVRDEDIKIYKNPKRTGIPRGTEERTDGKTVMIGRKPANGSMSPEERYIASAVHRSAGQRPRYETRIRQVSQSQKDPRQKKRVPSHTVSQEEQDFFDHYGG